MSKKIEYKSINFLKNFSCFLFQYKNPKFSNLSSYFFQNKNFWCWEKKLLTLINNFLTKNMCLTDSFDLFKKKYKFYQ